MAGLILLKPGVDWTATGGLFDWTLEFIMSKIADRATAAYLREIVDNNLGSFWLTELPVEAQQQVIDVLRDGLVEAAQRELPEGERKAEVVGRLQELVDLTKVVGP